MRVCVVGLGQIGLVAAACLAEFGWSVHGMECDVERAAGLSQGRVPDHEPGLAELVRRQIQLGRLSISTSAGDFVDRVDLILFADQPPARHVQLGSDDPSDILRELAPRLNGLTVIGVVASVAEGRCRKIELLLRDLGHTAEVVVCAHPLFLRQGSAIHDFCNPDRIVVGSDDTRVQHLITQLYRPLAARKVPIICVRRQSAALATCAVNAFLALKLSYINELSDLSEKLGADINEVSHIVGSDRRIGASHLSSGPGFGGVQLPRDVLSLIRLGRDHGVPMTIAEMAYHANEDRKLSIADRICDVMGGNIHGKTVGILGVTYKPNAHGIDEAASSVVIPMLQGVGADIRAYDPYGPQCGEARLRNVVWCDTSLEAAKSADLVVLLTAWDEFRGLNLWDLRYAMRGDTLFDCCNVFDPVIASTAGLKYVGLGNPTRPPIFGGGESTRVVCKTGGQPCAFKGGDRL